MVLDSAMLLLRGREKGSRSRAVRPLPGWEERGHDRPGRLPGDARHVAAQVVDGREEAPPRQTQSAGRDHREALAVRAALGLEAIAQDPLRDLDELRRIAGPQAVPTCSCA